jgi:hypothetical protein
MDEHECSECGVDRRTLFGGAVAAAAIAAGGGGIGWRDGADGGARVR